MYKISKCSSFTRFFYFCKNNCYKSVRCLSFNSEMRRSDSIKTVSAPYQSISDCYANKSVFITGGTGFLGKILIERLLYNCSDINNIYVLIRGKKGMNTGTRLQQMLNVPLFEKLKSVKPNALNKIIPIEGDMTKDELGIKSDDQQKIVDNVSMVFHSAATVKFTDSFSDIMNINYEGTKKVVDLGKKVKNLESFLYFSTAFSNADKLIIEEMIYPPTRQIDEVVSFIENHGDDPEEVFKFLRGNPNTYTISKSLCESYVDENHSPMKSIILRPAIVTPVYKDPLPGWLDSWVAASATFSDVARGLTKVIYGDRNVVCDLIPADYVCNLAIVASARGNNSDKVIVYNACSSSTNPITWKHASDLYLQESLKHGKSALKPLPVILTTSPKIVNLLTLTLQVAPAFFADLMLRFKGHKPKYMEMEKRAILLRDILDKFTSTSLHIKSEKTLTLIDTLDEKDKVRYPFDARTIQWRRYMPIFYRGIQKYMLKSNQ